MAGAGDAPAAWDTGQPEALAAKSAARLVDLSPIDKIHAVLRFEGTAALMVLQEPGLLAVAAHVEKTVRGAKKDESKKRKETIRLAETIRFELEMSYESTGVGVRILVGAVDWGELASMKQLPEDEVACQSALDLVEGPLGMWASLHLRGKAWASERYPILGAVELPAGIEVSVAEPGGTANYLLEKETFLPLSFRQGDILLRYRYKPIGKRETLSHFDFIKTGTLVTQVDLGVADGAVVPIPTTLVRREGTHVFTAHLDDIRIEDDDAPFLAEQASPSAR
jgi:hypothetical protein